MNDWRKTIENIQSLLRELPSKPTEETDIGSFEALEREISAAVDGLYAGRLENMLRSLAERAPTLESLEKIEGEVESVFREVRNKRAADIRNTKIWSLLNHASDGALTADVGTGLILDANEAILNWLGYAREELLGLRVQDIDESLPPALSESWRSWVAEIEAGGEPLQLERVFNGKDGSIPVELSVFLRNVDHKDCLVFVARDITERKNVEEQLRHRARFLGRLLNGSVDGILAFDRDCVLKFCSPALERSLGVDRHELVGTNAWEALPFLKELGEDPYFYQALEGKRVISRDRSYTIPRSNRRVIFDIHYMPLLGESDEVIGGIAVIREMTRQRETERALAEAKLALDVQQRELTAAHEAARERTAAHEAAQERTERRLNELKTAKEVLHESEETLRAIVENLPDSVATVNGDGQIVFRNRAWPTDAGQKDAADFYDFIRSEDQTKVRNGLERVFRTGEPECLEFEAVDGARYESRLVPLTRDGSNVTAIILSPEEMTKKVEPEEQELKPSERAQPDHEMENLALVAGGVVRDYDKLLTDVLGYVGSVLHDLPPGSSARYAIEQIEAATLRATELTEQLRAYTDKDLADAQLVDLGCLVDEMMHILEQVAPPKVILEKRTSGTELPIRADVGQIRKLILNLVRNASDALAEHQGIITLATGTVEASREFLSDCFLGDELPEGSYVYLEVSDTGKGMDEDTLGRVFVPFFTTKAIGDGLGLSTVAGTVRRHGGAIRLKSTPDQGTKVRVVLPQRGLREVAHMESDGRSWSKTE